MRVDETWWETLVSGRNDDWLMSAGEQWWAVPTLLLLSTIRGNDDSVPARWIRTGNSSMCDRQSKLVWRIAAQGLALLVTLSLGLSPLAAKEPASLTANGTKDASAKERTAPDASDPVKQPSPAKTTGSKSGSKSDSRSEQKVLQKSEQKKAHKSPERVAAILAFAREHHPELAELLARLEMTDGKQFEKALADLGKDVDRLDRTKSNNPVQYERALRRWKLDSRIRLIVARLSMADSSELEAELRAAIEERLTLRQQDLRDEAVQLKKRLESNTRQQQDLDTNREKLLEQEFLQLRTTVGGTRDRLRKKDKSKLEAGQSASKPATPPDAATSPEPDTEPNTTTPKKPAAPESTD
jgi:hypothetical protein